MAEGIKPGTRIALGMIPLSDIIAQIHIAAQTVVITIKHGETAKNIFIKDGAIVFANSNLKTDSIRQILINEKKLSSTQLSTLDDFIARNNAKFLDALLELGYYPKDKVEDLKAMQARHVVVESHGMSEGELSVVQSDAVFSKISHYRIDAHNTVFEGIKKYVSKDAIISCMPTFTMDNFFKLTPKSENDTLIAKMPPEQKGLMTIIESTPKISEVLEASFVKGDIVYKHLYCLKIFGYIEIEETQVREARLLDTRLSDTDKKLKSALLSFYDSLAGMNYYQLLGVEEIASQTELETAFGTLKQKYDPSRHKRLFAGSEKNIPDRLLAKLKEAYEVLVDDAKRSEYDSFMARGEAHKFGEKSSLLARGDLYSAARAAIAKMDWNSAIAPLEKALELNPKDHEILCELAMVIFAKSAGKDNAMINKAMSFLKTAHDSNPNYFKTYLGLGTIYKAIGKNQQSLDAFKKALFLNPNCADAEKEITAVDPKSIDGVKTRGLYNGIEKFNYYELLDIERAATADDVKKAYHAATKRYHPDKHFNDEDVSLKDMTKAIYKRIVEAYMVLKGSQTRKEYDEQLGAYKEEKEIRLKDASDVVQKKDRSEIIFKSSQSRKFFELGMTSFSIGKLNAAKINFQLALKAEPDNLHIKKKLKEVIDMEKGQNDV
jgi:curved DNA-binding protein CbpA